MKLVFPKDDKMRITPETIYRFIYSDEYKHRKFREYLPRKRKRKRHKLGRSVHRGSIPHRIFIHERPGIVSQNVEFGHFEGDSVEGLNHKDGVHTEVERISRKYFAILVSTINSEEGIRAQKEIFDKLPEFARKSTTLDNGRENHLHYKLKKLGMNTYFADPYSSWQRGSNEYHNGLFRRYFPKKTNFKFVTQDDINEVLEEINNRPRKCLGYYTPN